MRDKVLVAMSGGVDSSVALLKIAEMGYDAIGVTMKLWEYRDVGGNLLDDSNCCSVGAINNAKLVCDRMNVPHYTLDFTEVFKKTVVENFSEEYLAGRTPNPCVRCNSYVKWDAFIEKADQLGAKYIATGHYAKVKHQNNISILQKGKDPLKDQAYVLWGIPANTLSRTIFPLGDLTKDEVRQIARDNNLETANIPESMEICFVADNNYKRFLKEYKPDKVSKINKGDIIDQDGKKIGEHNGYINYTIGQRKGLGISSPEPNYVSNINPKSNKITVGKKQDLEGNSCLVTNPNWLIPNIKFPLNIHAQIRYNSKAVEAKIIKHNQSIIIQFQKPQIAITPGQSIVFYDKNNVIGGAIIEKNIH